MSKTKLNRNRRQLLQLAASGALGMAGLSSLIQQSLAMGSRPIAQGIRRVKGEVFINKTRATLGMRVQLGDSIETGRESQAVVVVGLDAFLIGENTVLVIGGKNALVRTLKLLSGRLLSVFEPKRNRRVIKTNIATYGIRGTGIYVETNPKRDYVCTCYGTADLTPKKYPQLAQTVETNHHEQPRYIYTDKRSGVITRAPVKNHTDDELFMLEGLVNRWPPFEESEY